MAKRIKTVKITRSEVVNIINKIPFTAFFGTTFIKADGTLRKMNCNRSISNGLKNQRTPSKVTTTKINVFDVNVVNENTSKGGYRYVNLETILEIRTNGKRYIVK